MREKIVVMGVDLGLRNLISTSAYYGFGDEMMLHTINRDYSQSVDWISEQIQTGSRWLLGWAKEKQANVLALEDLKTHCLDVGENQKDALRMLIKWIKGEAAHHGIPIEFVHSAYTSQLCSDCGRMGCREGFGFCCPNCGYETNADVNAARNIGFRGIIRRAERDKKAGFDPRDRYFLATLYGPQPIDEIEWVKSIIFGTPSH